MQKVASVKAPRKTERKGPTNEIENGQSQKQTNENKSKFWLMRVRQIKIFYIFSRFRSVRSPFVGLVVVFVVFFLLPLTVLNFVCCPFPFCLSRPFYTGYLLRGMFFLAAVKSWMLITGEA